MKVLFILQMYKRVSRASCKFCDKVFWVIFIWQPSCKEREREREREREKHVLYTVFIFYRILSELFVKIQCGY